MMPSQKFGVDSPSSANTLAASPDRILYRRRDDAGRDPDEIAMMKAITASCNVTGSFCTRSSATLHVEPHRLAEVALHHPDEPVAVLDRQRAGRASRSSRICPPTVSGLRSSPARINGRARRAAIAAARRSAPTRRTRVGMSCSMRLARKVSIGARLPACGRGAEPGSHRARHELAASIAGSALPASGMTASRHFNLNPTTRTSPSGTGMIALELAWSARSAPCGDRDRGSGFSVSRTFATFS